MMRTRVLSTVILALALVGAPHVVMAQSTNEAAVAQAVEAFRNALLKADRGQFDALTAALKSHNETYTFGFYKRDGTGGHATTPYAVEDKGGGQFAVLMYDNNYPLVTRVMWIAEGFTTYYGNLMLRRSGLWGDAEYLNHVGQLIGGIENAPGSRLMSAEESSR